jgi:hypothetical protein
MDVSSEMVLNILPLFLSNVLGVELPPNQWTREMSSQYTETGEAP